MKFFYFIASAGLFISCNSSSSKNSESDSLVINFNQAGTNMIEKTVSTTEQKAIKELTRFVDAEKIKACNSELDGNLMFYKSGTLKADVSFSFKNDSCRQFIYMKDGETEATRMSKKAADFLESLLAGRNYY